MGPTDSFDPRTWKAGDPASGGTPVTALSPAPPVPDPQPDATPAPRWWLGLALSAAILLAGALAAYATRGDKLVHAPVESAQ